MRRIIREWLGINNLVSSLDRKPDRNEMQYLEVDKLKTVVSALCDFLGIDIYETARCGDQETREKLNRDSQSKARGLASYYQMHTLGGSTVIEIIKRK